MNRLFASCLAFMALVASVPLSAQTAPVTVAGKTSGGVQVPLLVGSDGTLATSGGGGGGGSAVAQGSTTSGQLGSLTQCAVLTAAPTYTTATTNPLSCDPSGNLRISGTLTTGGLNQGSTTSGQQGGLSMAAATTAAPSLSTGNTYALSQTLAGALRIDGSGVTQPVSAASLPLPTGAATQTTLALLPLAQGSTTSGQSGPLIQGAVTTGVPTYTNAQTAPLSLDTTGKLRTFSTVSGDIGSGVSDTGNPVKIGGFGNATPPTAVTTGQRVNAWYTLTGQAVTASEVTQGSTTSGQLGSLVQCATTTSAPTTTTAQTSPLSCDTAGALRITGTITTGGLNQGSTTSGQQGGLSMGAVTTAAPTYTTAQTSPLSLTTAGALRIDGSGVTQPVSAASLPLPTGAATAAGLTTINSTLGTPFQAGGSIGNTSFAATQSGTWNITNVSGTVSLPTGAATAAKQPALGTAGAASTDVITVQGIASGVAQPVSGTVAATQSGTWNVGTVTTLPALPANQSTNEAQINGVTPLMGNGVSGTGAQRVTIASDNTAFSVNTISGQTGIAGGSGAVTAATVRTVPAAITYKTIAASQTNFALGTGAIGDYLSHCIIQPTTTAAGTMTILDNATVIYTFTTGTLLDLRSIPVPVGAISISGAWKVTTGANETATCFGVFTP